jgi:hypothetical protein
MRRHRYNLRSAAADSSDEEDAAADAGCPGCRRTAPYYATKLLNPDADEKDREELVQRLQTTPFFRGIIARGHPPYPRIGARAPPPGGISICAIYQWLMGSYHSLHYFILINFAGRLICIDSWNDGTRWRNLEIRCWTREDAAALIALTSIRNHEMYNAIITQLFNVTLPQPFDDSRPLVIEYLSADAIADLIGESGGERTELLVSKIITYCATGQTLETFFTT